MIDFKAVAPVAVAARGLAVAVTAPRTPLDLVTGRRPPRAQVLNDVSFSASPGQVIAIMGASGSGKTTLLHALAGRIHNATLTGSILFDGRDPQPFFDNGSVAYVQQHDHLMPYLTVRETLRYCAELRLPSSMPTSEKFDLVEQVILELGLKECADTIIGDDWRKGISGGEKRRVSVGCQLLLNPSVIFMDEPTTGLDSFTSYNLIETLVNLSRKGRTVFVSIHQPRSDIFRLFDSIILLSKGRTVYAGQGGQTALSYFESLGHRIPENTNPADALIDVCSIDNRDADSEDKSRAVVDSLVKSWAVAVASGKNRDFQLPESRAVESIRRRSLEARRRSLPMATAADAKEPNAAGRRNSTDPATGVVIETANVPPTNAGGSGAGFLAQCAILTRRSWKNLLRDNLSLWGNLAEAIIVGLVFGYIFFRLEDTLPGVLSRRAALYIATSMQTYLMLIFVIYKLCGDMKVFDRERADHMYGVVPYVFGQFTSQLPFNVLFPLIYAILMYFMMGMRTDDLAVHFGRFALANILAHFVIVAYAQFCVAIARDFATASLIGNAMYTFFSFSTGFFVQLDAIPVYLRWISKISFMTYEFRLLATNEFSGNVYACADVGRPCDGNAVLKSLAIAVDDYVVPPLMLCAIFAFFLVSGTVLLQLLSFDLNKHAGAVKSSIKVGSSRQSGTSADGGESAKGVHAIEKIDVQVQSIHLELITRSLIPGRQSTKKTLLEDITADFPAGELTIIMGGSGTGKSTLLSVLTARRLRSGAMSDLKQTGQVLFNGIAESNPARIASVCSFVRQSDDHLLPALTCRETLHFAARLRLPSDWTMPQKADRAEEVLNLLGLRHCANTIVGDESKKGLSGGEKRRLSIGVQMLTDPSVLVIDEPTSGLDAFTAHHIMVSLKQIAATGRTIICSIHQPRSDIYTMFDNIVLLTRGGRVAFSGPARRMTQHFAALGHKLPTLTNPADFVLDVSSVDLRDEEAERRTRAQVDALVSHWRMHGIATHSADDASPFSNDKDAAAHPSVSDGSGSADLAAPPKAFELRKIAPFTTSFPVLARRSFINTVRQPHIVVARVMQVLALGIVQALYFARQGNDQVSVQNRLGVLQQTVSAIFVGLLNCISQFPAERSILFYEHADRAYSVEPFFLAYNMIEIPIEMFSSLAYTVFAMVIVGINTTVGNFFCMSLAVFCFVNVGETIGIAFCSIVTHVGFSVSLTNSVLGIFVVMSGILSSNMPVVLDRLNRVSPIPYLTRLMAIREFDSSARFTCSEEDVQTGNCIYRTGSDVLRLLTSNDNIMGFESDKFVYYITVGVVLTVVYRIAAYALLKWRAARM
ncbi:hypothetical protein HK105_202429 [Polyrhizophydium stewartii]|uniref:ABC transporter domain-containing protein n=1 Tax=Polyrhizophydium stewartii TaxID=2732419 RepID=A0ABR4NEU0_9FUNG